MFWDSSALVPLIVPAAQSKTLTGHLASDGGVRWSRFFGQRAKVNTVALTV